MSSTVSDLLLPGYSVDPLTGAWCSIPWPSTWEEKDALIKNSIAPGLIDWSEGRTDEPGLIHYMHGTPWEWTKGQKRFLVLWYLLDEDGRFVYRSGVKRGAKGTGKDPMLAAMANTELLGPVEPYDRDDKTGMWIARKRGFPLVQVMSNSEEQSKKVLRIANGMWSRAAKLHYELDCGATRTLIKGTGARFEVPTAAEESSEGDPVTFAGINESHHMNSSNGGQDNADVIRRNVAKSPASVQARVIEFTNAHRQGMDSVAERSYEAWQHQMATDYAGKRDILYDTIESPPDSDILSEEGRMRALRAAYMDADWNDIQRISDEMADRRTTVADAIRFYLNGLGSEEDSWVEPAGWDQLAEPQVVADKDRVALFLDCSKSEDATGLVGCRIDDLPYVTEENARYYLFKLGVWQRPHGLPKKQLWRAPRAEVDATVRAAFSRYYVVWFGVDPSPAKDDTEEALYWTALIDSWHQDLGKKIPVWCTPRHSCLFDMRLSEHGGATRNKEFTEAAELVAKWVDEEGLDGPLRHDGDPIMRTQVHNARRRPNTWGVSLGKVTRDSNKLVDLAVCGVGAVMGARKALNSGKLKKKATPTRVIVL
jgi:hypothetical protein